MQLVAIFGPTGVGKTAVAIELAERLRQRGEDPAAVSCDAIAVYRGLEVISGAPTAAERADLEHRLVGIADLGEEFSAGRFAELARAEIDSLLEAGRRPILVGGTGLYMRAALAELTLSPPVDPAIRAAVETEIADRGPAALHAELAADVAERIHPNDRKRIARATELLRAGEEPPERRTELWAASLRHPTFLAGIVAERERLGELISARVERMVAAGALEEVLAAERLGPARTARAALGYEQLLDGNVEAMKASHRRYARRQVTWLRRMEGIELFDRTGAEPGELAERIAARLQ